MANSDKLIGIFPNTGETGVPRILFVGSGNKPINLRVEDDNRLNFVNSSGNHLFSIGESGNSSFGSGLAVSGSISADMVYINGVAVSVSGHLHSIGEVVSLSGILDKKIDDDDPIEGGFF